MTTIKLDIPYNEKISILEKNGYVIKEEEIEYYDFENIVGINKQNVFKVYKNGEELYEEYIFSRTPTLYIMYIDSHGPIKKAFEHLVKKYLIKLLNNQGNEQFNRNKKSIVFRTFKPKRRRHNR